MGFLAQQTGCSEPHGGARVSSGCHDRGVADPQRCADASVCRACQRAPSNRSVRPDDTLQTQCYAAVPLRSFRSALGVDWQMLE